VHTGSADTEGQDEISPELAAALEPLRSDPAHAAILCDLDGTLAPIADRPEAAAVPDATREVLRALARRYALVAIVTGRRAAQAREMVGLDDLTYSGNHGFEVLPPGAGDPVPDPALNGHTEDVSRFVAGLDRAELERIGFRIEDKGAIFALHWRQAGNQGEAEARASEIESDAEWNGLVPRFGRKVLEIRPDVSIDKGIAVQSLLHDDRLSAALYGGDDRTDADAFRALHGLRDAGRLTAAVAVAVASEEAPPEVLTEADHLVEGTEGYLQVLQHLAS
jgi:trehalose 6-phosphate phosphatase